MKKLFFPATILVLVSLALFSFSLKQKSISFQVNNPSDGAIGTVRFIVKQNGVESVSLQKYVKAKIIITNRGSNETIVLNSVNMKFRKDEYVSQLVHLEAGQYNIESLSFLPSEYKQEDAEKQVQPNLIFPVFFTVNE